MFMATGDLQCCLKNSLPTSRTVLHMVSLVAFSNLTEVLCKKEILMPSLPVRQLHDRLADLSPTDITKVLKTSLMILLNAKHASLECSKKEEE